MIDIENKIVDTLDGALSNVCVTTSYMIAEKDLPAVQVFYDYTGDFSRTFDNQLTPHHAKISVQTDTYSLNRDNAKQINATVVDTMHQMKFTCTDSKDLSGYYNGLFRITSRFTAIVGEGETDGTTTTYHMYRR